MKVHAVINKLKVSRDRSYVSITDGMDLKIRNCHTISKAIEFENSLHSAPEAAKQWLYVGIFKLEVY